MPLRRAVAMVCMALAAMLSGQTYISLMDRIDHAHHHAHFANPLAGSIEFAKVADSSPSEHPHHHGKNADHHAQDGAGHQHSHGPADHQHGGDAAIVFLAAQSFVLAASPIPALRYETGSPKLVSFNPRGPDHPPKSGLAIRV